MNKASHSHRSHMPPIIVQEYRSSSQQQEAQNYRFFLSSFLCFFFVRNYMVQVLNLEQGRSPPVKWVCHRWRRRVCNCVNEPPSMRRRLGFKSNFAYQHTKNTCIYTYKHSHIHINFHAYTPINTHTYIYTSKHSHIHINFHAYTPINTRTYI